MAKNTRPLSGASQRKYFRDLLRSDAGVSPEAAERLTDICVKEIAQIRVRLPLAVRKPAKTAAVQAVQTRAADAAPVIAAAAGTAAAESAFDPNGFSLIVTLRKAGPEGLAAKLKAVAGLDQLRAIAKAQHVALDGALTDTDAVISAIVEGTERRLAHRQAAAS